MVANGTGRKVGKGRKTSRTPGDGEGSRRSGEESKGTGGGVGWGKDCGKRKRDGRKTQENVF